MKYGDLIAISPLKPKKFFGSFFQKRTASFDSLRRPGLRLTRAILLENLLDRHPKHPRDPEGQRQTRIVTFRFNRVHRLPRYTEPPAQIAL
jgi:hypothetical protein